MIIVMQTATANPGNVVLDLRSLANVFWNGLMILLQIAAGILIWLPQFRKFVVGFFFVFMLSFSIVHLANKTDDIGGSMFMAILLGLLVWNPSFISGKKSG